MIHAFAIEPKVAAAWGRRDEFRFIRDKFGFGTPRVLFELPVFKKWKRAVLDATNALNLSETDLKRIEELFRLFGGHRIRRLDAIYDGNHGWLENAEAEYDRKNFRAVIAAENPRKHRAVLLTDELGFEQPMAWACPSACAPKRTAVEIAKALAPMLSNCCALHFVDPHFGPENARHRKVLEALVATVFSGGLQPQIICVHCIKKTELSFFDGAVRNLVARIPSGMRVEFCRWSQRAGGEKLHNRYVLTELGGISLGIGLDEGSSGETDDFLLLSQSQYMQRWSQYVGTSVAFDLVDTPKPVVGTKAT